MGHLRGQLPPDTAKWLPVIERIAEGDDVATIAFATIEAAKKGLELAKTDKGLQHAIWLLAHVTVAARQDNFVAALTERGVELPRDATAVDVVAAFSDAMDRHLSSGRSRTDIGEMAQLAAAETISDLVGRESTGLFGQSPETVQAAIRSFSTKDGFASLAHSFFARFTERYLGYHISRELSRHVGENQRFSDPVAHTEFLERLGDYSRQVALIVKEYSGGWYSKSRFETGISERSAKGFASYAVKKIKDELKRRGQRHAR